MGPDRHRAGSGRGLIQEGESARQAVAEGRRQTTSRRELSRHPAFGAISPGPGQLDESALDDALRSEPDRALALLADMSGAMDRGLADLARRLAGRVAVRLGHEGRPRDRGVGQLRPTPAGPEGDLDLDASLDAVLEARASGRSPRPEDLWARSWARSEPALCLVVDRSGSMGGGRLAAAALAAAVVAHRAPRDHSVLAFADQVVVLQAQGAGRPTEAVVGDLLALRGHGPTDLALALEAARAQLERSVARRRTVILLSDGRPTAGTEPLAEARRIEELLVLAPAGDSTEARALAGAAGGRWAELRGPTDVPRALSALLHG